MWNRPLCHTLNQRSQLEESLKMEPKFGNVVCPCDFSCLDVDWPLCSRAGQAEARCILWSLFFLTALQETNTLIHSYEKLKKHQQWEREILNTAKQSILLPNTLSSQFCVSSVMKKRQGLESRTLPTDGKGNLIFSSLDVRLKVDALFVHVLDVHPAESEFKLLSLLAWKMELTVTFSLNCKLFQESWL